MSARADAAAALARRRELLELQAQLQRVTLAATFAQWQAERSSFWLGALARTVANLWATPRIRWMVLAALSQRIVRPLLQRLFQRR